jgi:hypothetical protein
MYGGYCVTLVMTMVMTILNRRLADLYVRANLNCTSPIELAYHSAGYEIYSASTVHGTEENLVEEAGQ